MKPVALIAVVALLWVAAVANARAQDLVRPPHETDLAFAERVLHVDDDNDPHVVAAAWNGVPTLFVDYQTTTGEETNRPVVALMRQPDGRFRLIHITVGEEEGGSADLAAIGFADADHSGAKALVTIISWEQNHHMLVSGTLYEVRIFAAPRPGQTDLVPLKLSSHFDGGCECWHEDGPPKHPEYQTHYRFKTIAAIKRELHKMGY